MIFSKQSLARGLTLAAAVVAEEIRKITSVGGKGGYPKPISKSITVGTAEVTDDGGRIGITSEPKGEDNVELTLAFELGSGLFGKGRQKYKIEPRRAGGVLHFPWSVAQNIEPGRPPGTLAQSVVHPIPGTDPQEAEAFLPYVMHPGIKPRPFLQRAMNQSVDRVLEILDQSFEYQILDGPKVEVIK